MSKPFVIIGAGVGGLALALRLAHRGERVIVLEKTDQVGGRNREMKVGAADFDGGPTLMMMLDPFRKLFSDVGTTLEQHLEISLCEPSYRVFYSDGTRLDASTRETAMVSQIQALSGSKDATAYPRLLADLKALYDDSLPNFIRSNFSNPLVTFSPKNLRMVMKHRMLGNLSKRIHRTIDDEKLRMLFSFQTMYLGLSPYDAPWVYSTLAYMEYGEGIWYPKGGMPKISTSIANLAALKGAEIRLNSSVARINGTSVELESGEIIEAKAIISNADLPYTDRALAPGGRTAKGRRYSCSAYVLYLDYNGALPELLHHNVFFGQDFKGNLDDIFHRQALPKDPAFYASISARTDPVRAENGHENLYLLIPCANLDRPFTGSDSAALRHAAFTRLTAEVGFDPALVVAEASFGPNEWQSVLNLEKGAAFGLSHDLFQSAFFRPPNYSKSNPNLFYVGASTTPGNGLPMVLISAELVEQRLESRGLLNR